MVRPKTPETATQSIARRLLRTRRDPPCPAFPPIEFVAADLRRLRTLLEGLPPGTSYVRSIGVARAYDEVLALACRQLEVPTRILDLPDGKPRILERLRVEFMLGECGLRL